jgi:hypothetical protein
MVCVFGDPDLIGRVCRDKKWVRTLALCPLVVVVVHDDTTLEHGSSGARGRMV